MSYETLGQLDARVRGFLSESSTRFFDPIFVTQWINEAQDFITDEELYAVRGQWRRYAIPGAWLYLLPEDLVAPEALYARTSSGAGYRVDFYEGDQVDRVSYMARRVTTSGMVTEVTYRRVAEGLAAEIYPALNARLPLVFYGAKRMKRLVNTSDRTECPPALTHIIVHYCLWAAKMKDEEPRQAQMARDVLMRDVMELRARRMREAASDQYPRARARRGVGRFWR